MKKRMKGRDRERRSRAANLIRNLDPVDDRGCAGEGALSAILF